MQGNLDLEQFATGKAARTGSKVWLKVAEQLDASEMPPKGAKQPTADQRKLLRGWVDKFLHAEALANAGDPGPVVLRRLNNAEYTYTVRDLTGVDLDPAREFPADSAAGEGFTNAGSAMSMSPALLNKYLAAGKDIASHAVLLPDGFRFSKSATQRDWTNEVQSKIRAFYLRRVEAVELGLGTSVGVLNIQADCQLGQVGRLPLEKYFAATLALRNAQTTGSPASERLRIASLAADRGLNAKYLGLLWSSLNSTEPSRLLDQLRACWRMAKPGDASVLVEDVSRWQRGLWTFYPIGLQGRNGARPQWQQPVSPLVTKQEFRIPILTDELRELASVKAALADLERYQDMSAGGQVLVPVEFKSAAGAVAKVNPDASVLVSDSRDRDTYTVKAIAPAGIEIRYLRLEALTDPSLPAKGPGYHVGDAVGIGAGNFVVSGFSATYASSEGKSQPMPIKFKSAKADFERAGFPITAVFDRALRKGWSIHPAVGLNHVATFEVAPEVKIPAGSLLSISIDQSYSNRHGLGKFRLSVTNALAPPQSRKSPAHDALVARRTHYEQIINAPETVVSLVVTDCGDGNDQDFVVWQRPRLVADKQPDILLRELRGLAPAQFGKHPNGKAIDGASLCVRAPRVISLRLPTKLAMSRTLVTTAIIDPDAGKQASVQSDVVVGEAVSHPGLIPATTTLTLTQNTALEPDQRTLAFKHPILLSEASTLKSRMEAALQTHRNLFPPSLCYPQIVPFDGGFTLTFYHQEDEHLKRLLLSDSEKQEIDRLWEEFRFISQDPLRQNVAIVGLLEIVKDHDKQQAQTEFVKPIRHRVDAFRKHLAEIEPRQLAVLLDFASRAYRRPLQEQEADELRGLYRRLRSEGISHEEAFRTTLATTFVAPPFLYRLDNVPEGASSSPVSDVELANRLSYFLWSSVPDAELRAAAANGTLHHSDVLEQQTRRMLKDARIRRLATEFACQWLHIHDFPLTESKSRQLFPEFVDLRSDMYEESILFLTDLFQRDASLLNVLNADHTFVNERLANFYGIPAITGHNWRRIDGMRQHGRGGILGQATALAKQSGASRTSPILRGNWVSEVLLGEKLPRPPKNVPQLADTVPAGLTERQMIERHSSDVACAKCHQRIDPLGFSLEGFDAIGRRRERNQSGIVIDTRTKLPDGREIDGLTGLRSYLVEQRRDAVVRQFCRKLLGYALGRETQLSDQPLLAEMQRKLAEHDYRISTAILAVIQSRQFREIRGKDFPTSGMH
jgi:hypothetical protein